MMMMIINSFITVNIIINLGKNWERESECESEREKESEREEQLSLIKPSDILSFANDEVRVKNFSTLFGSRSQDPKSLIITCVRWWKKLLLIREKEREREFKVEVENLSQQQEIYLR